MRWSPYLRVFFKMTFRLFQEMNVVYQTRCGTFRSHVSNARIDERTRGLEKWFMDKRAAFDAKPFDK